MWGLACVSGRGRECYFLLAVDDYTRYTTIFSLRSKGEVPDVLIPWIRAVRLQLREQFRPDLLVLRLHSDRFDPLPGTVPVKVAVNSGAAQGAASWGAASRGAEPRGAESEGAESGGAEPGGEEPGGAEPGGAEPASVERGGAKPERVEPGGAESEGLMYGGWKKLPEAKVSQEMKQITMQLDLTPIVKEEGEEAAAEGGDGEKVQEALAGGGGGVEASGSTSGAAGREGEQQQGKAKAPTLPQRRKPKGVVMKGWETLVSRPGCNRMATKKLTTGADLAGPPRFFFCPARSAHRALPKAHLAPCLDTARRGHTCTDLGELTSYLGLRITRDRAQRTITLPQSHMVQQVLQRFGFTYSSPQSTPLPTGHWLSGPPSDESVEPSGPYVELVGCLIYLMTCTRPDLEYPLSLLARYIAPSRQRKVHWDATKRVLRYLCSTSGMGLVLGGRARVVLTGHADASWVDDLATQRLSQGYTFSLGSGSVSWRFTRSSSVLSSSCEAEIYTGAMAAEDLRWLTYLLTDLGEAPRSPPVIYVDHKAMLALCQEHRLEHRTKHIALCYFLARELQQRGQLRLAYVASQANSGDDFTKALQPSCFAFLDWSCDLLFSPTLPMGYDPDEEEEPAYCFLAPAPEEPAGIEETLAGQDRENRLVFRDAEYQSLLQNGTWDLVVLHEGKKAVQCKWVLRIKTDDKGQVTIYKSRLVAKGFMQKEKQEFNEIFARTAKHPTLRVLLADAAVSGKFIIQMDISTAFLNGILEEDLYMTQPPGYEDEMHVERDPDHTWFKLHLEKFIKELGEKYGIENERKIATSVRAEFKLVKAAEDEGVEAEEQQKFQSLAAIRGEASVTTQSNGVAKRANRTILETTRALLIESGVGDSMWPHAVRHATVARNRVHTKVGDGSCVPLERWLGRKPLVDMLRVFSCMAVAHVPNKYQSKLGASAIWDVTFVEGMMYGSWEKQPEAKVSQEMELITMQLDPIPSAWEEGEEAAAEGGDGVKVLDAPVCEGGVFVEEAIRGDWPGPEGCYATVL
ncbi:unnamed protein product [Closterium sp. NIES-53]